MTWRILCILEIKTSVFQLTSAIHFRMQNIHVCKHTKRVQCCAVLHYIGWLPLSFDFRLYTTNPTHIKIIFYLLPRKNATRVIKWSEPGNKGDTFHFVHLNGLKRRKTRKERTLIRTIKGAVLSPKMHILHTSHLSNCRGSNVKKKDFL